jgi:acyl-coenzyme A synthetase/AMP-(fatty) acid ligase
VRRDDIGTLWVRTAKMADGYVDDAVATARHFRDGWFLPGDLARVDGDGRLHLVGRADEMINLHGVKVSPAEIERVLEALPGVRAAAAFALPSAVHGQIPLAAVELASSDGPGADQLLAAARAALGVRAPRRVLVLDALPRNSAGKVVPARLVDLASRPA